MTQETAVTKQDGQRGNGAIVEAGAGIPGLSGQFGQQDIVLPVCSLAQPMSQDKGEEGRYSFPDGTSLESLDVVVLDLVATRALWTPIDDDSVDGPLCRSVDRVMGLTSFPLRVMGPDAEKGMTDGEPTYIECATCRFGPTATTFEKIGDLWCPYGYTLLLYDRTIDEPFLFFVKGSAVKVVKQRIVSPILRRLQRGKQAAPWTTPYTWTVAHKKDGKKNWYQPEIAAQPSVDDDDAALYAQMSASLSGRAAQQTEEAAGAGEQATMDVEG